MYDDPVLDKLKAEIKGARVVRRIFLNNDTQNAIRKTDEYIEELVDALMIASKQRAVTTEMLSALKTSQK